MKNIFITTTTFAHFSRTPLKLFKEKGYNVVLNDKGRKLNEDELVEKIPDFDGILAGTEVYSKRVLNKAVKLRAISRLGVGMDNIDLEFSKKKKIQVFKTQTTPAPAVAELTLGLILDLLRKISFQCSQLKTGTWKKKMGSLLTGKTLGIIGLGIIGKTLVEISQGFGLKYLAYDVQQDGAFAERYNLKYCSLSELLTSSDVVSIHLNLSKETKNIIDMKALGNMKQSAILINTSRGEIVDELDLKEALDNELIAGAGLDVYQKEPYNGPLLQYNNVIATPHIGAYAKEIRIQMELEAAKNLIRGLNEAN